MAILSTQERKYETKTFNGNFAKKVRICRLPFPETRSLNSLMCTITPRMKMERRTMKMKRKAVMTKVCGNFDILCEI